MQKTALKTVLYDLCSDGRPIPLCEVNCGVKKHRGELPRGRVPLQPREPHQSFPSRLTEVVCPGGCGDLTFFLVRD